MVEEGEGSNPVPVITLKSEKDKAPAPLSDLVMDGGSEGKPPQGFFQNPPFPQPYDHLRETI
jgi:hypothetical protein